VAARFDVNDVATVTCPGMDPTLYSDGCGYPDTAVRSPYVVLGSSPRPAPTARAASDSGAGSAANVVAAGLLSPPRHPS